MAAPSAISTMPTTMRTADMLKTVKARPALAHTAPAIQISTA
jgi:hypothetical protein